MDQALLILEQLYVHLPLKRAVHAIDPIQRLRLLKLHQGALNEREFQSEMIGVFVSLRDLHTNYILPDGYTSKFAFLPFRIEEYYDAHVRKYVVSWTSPVNRVRQLKTGTVVTHWNGSPIELAVARNADREAGSNLEARRARGIEALTLRWLGMSLPPDEDWVTLTYSDGSQTFESRFDWQITDAEDQDKLLAGLQNSSGNAESGAGWGLDLKTHLLQKIRKAIFDPPAVQAEREVSRLRAKTASRAKGTLEAAALPHPNISLFPEVFTRFGAIQTPSGQFGYVRLRSFAPETGDSEGAVREFARILATLPSDGLILDVRGNGGGIVNFGERSLQLLTPYSITPEPFHFITTARTLEIAANVWLAPWRDPIAQGIELGGSFSQGFPITDPASCNDIGQVYQGPVVLITDAFCYSTTDMFAAGFQDHRIGTILGIHHATGAGGANVWGYREVLQRLTFPRPNPFIPLPQGAQMRVAARRSTRVGARSGVPLEELGVMPDEIHEMTLNDTLNHNEDLIVHAAKILATKPKQTIRLTTPYARPVQQVTIESTNVEHVELLVNGRTVVSTDVAGTPIAVTLPTPTSAGTTLFAFGYRGAELVVSARILL